MIEPIFFIHIPKTAGTSLRYALSERFFQQNIFPSNSILRKNNGAYPSIDEIRKNTFRKEILGKKLIFGHYPFHLLKHFGYPKLNIISFLRDPIERTKSHLKHIKLHNARFSKESLIDIFNHTEFRIPQFDNLQCRYFLDGNPPRFLKEKDFSIAIKNIKKLTAVGISEEYNKSIQLIQDELKLKLEIKFENQFDQKVPKETIHNFVIDPDLEKLIAQSNVYDMQLYSLMCERLSKANLE